VVVEEGGGDGDDAGAFGQGAAELQAVPLAQGADVGEHEVRALRRVDLEAEVGQAAGEQVALGSQVLAQRRVVRIGQRQGLGDRVLEGAAADEGEELLDRLDRGHQFGRRLDPADLPAGEGERLACRADRYGPLAHAGELGDRHVLAVEDQVLVDLVGDHEQVALDGQVRDRGDLAGGEDRTGRVVRGVEQDEPGAHRHRLGQLVQVGAEVRRAQRDRDADAARHGDVRGVGVVVGLERDHLVARLDQGEHGGGDRLGGAGGDQHLVVRVVAQAPESLVVRGDGPAQFRYPRPGRVLVAATFEDGIGRRLGNLDRPVPVGEALAQVDGAGRDRARGHLGEYRRPEAFEAPVKQWSAHADHDIMPRPAAGRLGCGYASRIVPDPGQLTTGSQLRPRPGGAGRGRRAGR